MPRARSLLSSLRSPYDDAPSPFSFVETVETSPVEELHAPEVYLQPPTPEPDFAGAGERTPAVPLDVRLLPFAFAVTYWCGLAVLYAFFFFVIVCSSTWRGPVIIWAALIPTVVFALWRRLPGERQRVEKLCNEIVLLRCGGYCTLGDPEQRVRQRYAPAVETEMSERRGQSRERPRSLVNVNYAGLA